MPWVVLAPWAAWAVVRTFGWERGPLVPLVTFTPYMGLLSFVPLVVALVLRRWPAAVAGLVVVVLFGWALLPRAISGPQPSVRDGVEVRIMASNLFVGHGDPRTIVDLVRRERIDVLALEELTPEAVGRLDAAGLRRLLPHRIVLRGQGGAAGSGLYTRWPLRRLAPVNPHPTQGEPRGLVQVAGARAIDLEVIHPLPPTNASWRAQWNETLAALEKPDRSSETLRMLAGDFNATLDHARLRRLLGGDDGYVDAADATGKGYDTTWPAGRRFPPEITIDHVLVDQRVRVEAVRVHLVPGSDHRAVVAVVRVPRG
jgi:endonuclease/exonuclease/phosphatase (EEP) superfamily protein YafD